MKGKNSYVPKVGERVLISSPNQDDDVNYLYTEHEVLWMNETFILYGNEGYWPNLYKREHVHIKQLVEPINS